MQILRNPDAWPMWPVLPLKKRNPGAGFPWITGVLFADGKPTVYDLCPFKGWTQKEVEECRKYTYESYDELEADGWEVD